MRTKDINLPIVEKRPKIKRKMKILFPVLLSSRDIKKIIMNIRLNNKKSQISIGHRFGFNNNKR